MRVSCRARIMSFELYLFALWEVCPAHTTSAFLCTNCCSSGRTDQDSPSLPLWLRQQQYIQWRREQDDEQAGLHLQEWDQTKEKKPLTQKSLCDFSCGWRVCLSAACWGVILPTTVYKHHSKHHLPPSKGNTKFIFAYMCFFLTSSYSDPK